MPKNGVPFSEATVDVQFFQLQLRWLQWYPKCVISLPVKTALGCQKTRKKVEKQDVLQQKNPRSCFGACFGRSNNFWFIIFGSLKRTEMFFFLAWLKSLTLKESGRYKLWPGVGVPPKKRQWQIPSSKLT